MKNYPFFIFILSLTIFITACEDRQIIESKENINLKSTNIWNIVSENSELKEKYTYLNNLQFSKIFYRSDTFLVRGYMIAPINTENAPLIIFNRGGNREFARLSLRNLIETPAYLASNGYVILATDYRAEDEFGGSDIEDVLQLIGAGGEINNVNLSNIGMIGWSRGGIMTYLSLKMSNKIKAAAIINGTTDLFATLKERPHLDTAVFAKYIPDYKKKKTTALQERSAIYWLEKLHPYTNILLICGSKDRLVNPNQSFRMAKKLDSLHRDYCLITYEAGHALSETHNELRRDLLDWFNTQLK